MIPLKDQIPTRRIPVVNYALIVLNIAVFVLQFMAGPQQEQVVYQFALIPAHFITGLPRAISPTHSPARLCTAGWLISPEYAVFMDLWR
jgi:membrane associated rhomboid family serine protease